MQKVPAQFTGSEEDFVLVTGMICHSCLTNIKPFSAHKARYTPAYIQDILNRCDAAGKIPNQEQRQTRSVMLRGEVTDANAICCTNLLTLASYIQSGFPAGKVETMKKMAGGAYLEDARKNNWASATTMNSMMLTFIDTYKDDLTKGDMPDTFPGQCADNSKTYDDALETYNNNKEVAEQQAADRTNGFNGVNTSLKDIMKDGKLIFRKDAVIRKQFIYSAVMEKVTKNDRSGFRIAVTDGVTKLPVSTASIQFIEGEWLFRTNKRGIIYAKMPEGDYTGTITASKYQPVQVKFTSNKGVVHREEIILTAITEKVLAY